MMEQLEKLEKRYREIDEKMARPEVATDLQQLQALAQERASLDEVVTIYREYRAVAKSLDETRGMLDDELDDDMAALARQEIESLEGTLSWKSGLAPVAMKPLSSLLTSFVCTVATLNRGVGRPRF